jgi:hypothetical protein
MRVKKLLLWIFVMGACGGCKTVDRGAVDVFDDAVLVTKQQSVIDEQRRTIEDMGSVVESVREDLRLARGDVGQAIAETGDLRSQWRAIVLFVQRVIEAEQRLEELQRSNKSADAGEG